MEKLIRGRALAEDRWLRPETLDAAQLPAGAAVLVSLADWHQHKAMLLGRGGDLGVLLEPADDPHALAADLASLSLIAIRFPQFTDGRGYSSAYLLRQRLGWRGELRAVGDVLIDQLHYLARVGFDAFALRADQDPSRALAAFADFSEAYQASVDQPLPLFRRRRAGSAALAR